MGQHERRHGLIEKKRDHVPLFDPAVAEGFVNVSRAFVGVNHRAPVVRAQMVQNRREIGVAGKDDEFAEAGRMLKEIADVAGDLDVRAILELGGKRLAVHHLKPGDHKIRAHGRESMRIVRPAAADQNAAGIAVTSRHGETAADIILLRFEADEAPGRDPAHPFGWIASESPRCIFALTAQG